MLGCYRQAILVLRWFLDATRVAQLARDNQISAPTAYRYLHEAIDVLAAAAPSLHGALLAARTAAYSHVHLDGTLFYTTFKSLRRVSLCPWRIGAITAAALVLLHHQHGRTT
jgi:hypothetical protein